MILIEGNIITIPFKVDRIKQGPLGEYAQLHYKKHSVVILTEDLKGLPFTKCKYCDNQADLVTKNNDPMCMDCFKNH
jgi:hypothetical protein